MKLTFRLYILAFVSIGFNIPEIDSVPPSMRILQKLFYPRRVNGRRPPTFYEPDHSASESVYMYADNTYSVPEIDSQEIKYASSDSQERYATPPDPLGSIGHQNPHTMRKLRVRQLFQNNQIPSGGTAGNFNPPITTFRQINPPQTNAISNNIGGQFSNSFNPQDVALTQQQTFSPFPENSNAFSPQVSDLGGFISLPPATQQGRFPGLDLPTTSQNVQPMDFSGGFAPIDDALRQNIPDFSSVPPQSLNTMTQPPPSTNFFPAAFNQSFTTPLIEIGKPPPAGYRIEDNFQQSFLVSLIPEILQRRRRDAIDNIQVESSSSSQLFNPGSTIYQAPIQQSNSYAVPAQSNTYEAPVQIPNSYAAPVQSNTYGLHAQTPSHYEVPVQSIKYSAPIQTSSSYGVPIKAKTITYDVPSQTSSTYGVPIQTYSTTYEVPSQVVSSSYGVPNTYGTPNTYDTPNTYGTPNTYDIPNAYGTPKKISNAYGAPFKTKALKQGSIITKSKILFSPRLLAPRSMPFRVDRIIPPIRPLITGFSHSNATIGLIANITRLVNNTNSPNPAIGNNKTLVAVHLQSFSVLRPPGNDSDLIEGQKNYGFGAHNFQFGGIESLLTVFENLLKTGDTPTVTKREAKSTYGNIYGDGIGNDISSAVDPIDGILNIINATERIHIWAHTRGEDETGRRFQSYPRDPINDAIPFIDTAPITKTLSAAIF